MIAAAAFAIAAALSASQHDAIDKLVTSTMAAEHIAGATVVVSMKGVPVFGKSYGYADIATRAPATNETVYPIGSITKQFTAACVLLLAEEGKVSIDDPLSRYVDGLPWGSRVTLRHLLDQESGIADFRMGVADTSVALTESAAIDHLKQTDLQFAPGSKYEYSNSNYLLLGMVVEHVSGLSYPAYLRQRVLTPLGLTSTYYDEGQIAALAHGTTPSANGPQPIAPENPDWARGAGAIASTATDLAHWDDALWSGKLLSAASLGEMFTPGTLDDGSATDYAFGWVVVKHDGVREIWHNGEVTGFHAMNAMYPDQHTDVVVLTNTGGTFAADQLAVHIFDVVHPFVPGAADRAAADRAKEWLGRIEHGDVDRSQLSDQMNAALTDAVVKSAGSQLSAFGALKSIVVTSVDEDASGRSYSFTATLTKQTIRWVMGIDAQGKISALFFHL